MPSSSSSASLASATSARYVPVPQHEHTGTKPRFHISRSALLSALQVWRAKYAVAKIRKAARELLTLDEKVCRVVICFVPQPVPWLTLFSLPLLSRTPSGCLRVTPFCAACCALVCLTRIT